MDFNKSRKLIIGPFAATFVLIVIVSCIREPIMVPLQFKSYKGIEKKLLIQEDSLAAIVYGDYKDRPYEKSADIFIEFKGIRAESVNADPSNFNVVKPAGNPYRLSLIHEEDINALVIIIFGPDLQPGKNVQLEIKGVFKHDYLLDIEIPQY